MTKSQSLYVLAIPLFLAACGGGGGGGGGVTGTSASPASLNSGNQTVASQDVASMGLGLFYTSSTALGVDSPNDSILYAESFSHLDKFPKYFADSSANATVAGVVVSQSYNCPTSGSFSVSVNDADNNNVASGGDSISISFSNCVSGGATITGSLGFTINSLTGTYGTAPYSVSVTMSYNNLSVNATAYTASLNGAITVSGSVTGTNAFTQNLSITSLSASANYAGTTRSRSLSNFSATETRVANNTYTYISSTSTAGTLTSSGFSNGNGSVSFSTPTTFQRRGNASYPYTGVLLITGANNSSLKMTAISNTQVTLELDANGDSTYESSTTVNWNTLV